MMHNTDLFKRLLDNLYDGVYLVDPERTITYWNKGAERIAGYAAERVLGRSCFDNLLMHVDDEGTLLCGSLCPLAKTISDGEVREVQAYLHHAKGHRVPVLIRAAPIRNAEGEIVGAIESFSDNSSLIAALKRVTELHKTAMTDPLTAVGNRRHIESKMEACFHEAQQSGLPLGVMFVDIDYLKQVNDAHGHAIGDKVLQMFAKTLDSNLRSTDFLGRWGGDEFLASLLNVEAEQLTAIAEKLRVLIERSFLGLNHGTQDTLRVTASIGATLLRTDDTLESLVKRADLLLYQSKAEGRNRVSFS